MWFAALGSYQYSPSLIQLMSKLLDGCHHVIQSIDEPRLALGEEKLLKIRATLWDYDFTRLPMEWNKRIPRVSSVGSEMELETLLRKCVLSGVVLWVGHINIGHVRMYREYVPPIQARDRTVDYFLSHHRFIQRTTQNPISKTFYCA